MFTRFLTKFISSNTKNVTLFNLSKLYHPISRLLYKPLKTVYQKQIKCNLKLIRRETFSKFLGVSLLTSIWFQTNVEDVEDSISQLITLARAAMERGDYERAQDIIRLGLQISEEHKYYNEVPLLYDILSKILINNGNLKEAQSTITTAIEKLSMWGYPDNNYNILDFKLKLARIYTETGQNKLADIGYEYCLDQQKSKIMGGDTSGKTGILYMNILFWYGVHKIKLGKYPEAKELINTAYEFSEKVKGLTAKQEMIVMYTLADLSLDLGDLDTALESLENVIALCKKIGSTEIPICYLKLGTVYEKLDFKEKAIFAYKEAIKNAKIFGYFDIISEAEELLDELGESY